MSMTEAEVDALCDQIEKLLVQATDAMRQSDEAESLRLIKQVHELTMKLPTKKPPDVGRKH
jgi:hypothetical protein